MPTEGETGQTAQPSEQTLGGCGTVNEEHERVYERHVDGGHPASEPRARASSWTQTSSLGTMTEMESKAEPTIDDDS
jgi:hypothetical protein